MVKNVVASIAIILLAPAVSGLGKEALYAYFVTFFGHYGHAVTTYGFAGSAVLLALSFMLNRGAPFFLLNFFTRLALLVSQLAICLFLVAIIFVWHSLEKNLIKDIGYLVLAVPYALLASSSIALVIHDFNFPVRHLILENLALPLICTSVLLVLNYL